MKRDSKVVIKCITHSQPPADYNIQLRASPVQLNPDSKIGLYTIDKIDVGQEGMYDCIATNPSINGRRQIRSIQLIVASKFYLFTIFKNVDMSKINSYFCCIF